jgi:hypothetical protein
LGPTGAQGAAGFGPGAQGAQGIAGNRGRQGSQGAIGPGCQNCYGFNVWVGGTPNKSNSDDVHSCEYLLKKLILKMKYQIYRVFLFSFFFSD